MILDLVAGPMLARFFANAVMASGLGLQVLEQLVAFCTRAAFMNDCSEGGQHGERIDRLEHIAAHVDTGGALVDCAIGPFQRFALRQLLAAGNDDRNRPAECDALEAFFDIV